MFDSDYCSLNCFLVKKKHSLVSIDFLSESIDDMMLQSRINRNLCIPKYFEHVQFKHQIKFGASFFSNLQTNQKCLLSDLNLSLREISRYVGAWHSGPDTPGHAWRQLPRMEGSKRGGHRVVLSDMQSEIFVALFADMDTLTRYRSDNGFVGLLQRLVIWLNFCNPKNYSKSWMLSGSCLGKRSNNGTISWPMGMYFIFFPCPWDRDASPSSFIKVYRVWIWLPMM